LELGAWSLELGARSLELGAWRVSFNKKTQEWHEKKSCL
jgi:hypothetical protein